MWVSFKIKIDLRLANLGSKHTVTRHISAKQHKDNKYSVYSIVPRLNLGAVDKGQIGQCLVQRLTLLSSGAFFSEIASLIFILPFLVYRDAKVPRRAGSDDL